MSAGWSRSYACCVGRTRLIIKLHSEFVDQGSKLLIAGLLIGLSACTSISWRSDDGVLHNLGLVQCVIEESGGARIERRTSIGADLRLAGPTRGYSWGIHHDELVIPETSYHESPEALAESVAGYLSNCPTQPAKSETRLFFFDSASHAEPTWAKSTQIGAGVSVQNHSCSLGLGVDSSARVVGPAATESMAQLYLPAAAGCRDWSARAWRLRHPQDQGSAEHAGSNAN